MHYLLFYEKVADYVERQVPLQNAHRDYVMAAVDRGEIVLGGNLENPECGSALILFESNSPAMAESFAKSDPYVIYGVVNRWYIRAWDIVVGKAALPKALDCPSP